jgi:hypothetical protein
MAAGGDNKRIETDNPLVKYNPKFARFNKGTLLIPVITPLLLPNNHCTLTPHILTLTHSDVRNRPPSSLGFQNDTSSEKESPSEKGTSSAGTSSAGTSSEGTFSEQGFSNDEGSKNEGPEDKSLDKGKKGDHLENEEEEQFYDGSYFLQTE